MIEYFPSFEFPWRVFVLCTYFLLNLNKFEIFRVCNYSVGNYSLYWKGNLFNTVHYIQISVLWVPMLYLCTVVRAITVVLSLSTYTFASTSCEVSSSCCTFLSSLQGDLRCSQVYVLLISLVAASGYFCTSTDDWTWRRRRSHIGSGQCRWPRQMHTAEPSRRSTSWRAYYQMTSCSRYTMQPVEIC